MGPITDPSCQDSSLSIAANIMGIMTFAFAVFFGIAVRIQLVKRSRKEMRLMFIDLNYSLRELSGSMKLGEDTLRTLEPDEGVRRLREDLGHFASRVYEQRLDLRPWL